MKQLRIRFRLVSLILFALFVVLAVYGVFSINTYGSRWFTFEHNPRISQQKKHVAAGSRRSCFPLLTPFLGYDISEAKENGGDKP